MKQNVELIFSKSFSFEEKDQSIDFFIKNGFFVINLFASNIIFEAKIGLEKELKRLTGISPITLETYHEYELNNDCHINIQDKLTHFLQKINFSRSLMEQNLAWFKDIVGLDMSIQKYPYLRIARPKNPNDNIGFHRDTWYGASPYEISVLVPFTKMTKDNTLSLEPGSHGFVDTRYEYDKVVSPTVQKGSLKHQLGFPYMPGILRNKNHCALTPIPVNVGQALVFNLSALHGQELNNGECTRFSTDFRLTNSFANRNTSRSVHEDYYCLLTESPLHIQAKSYYLNNKGQK